MLTSGDIGWNAPSKDAEWTISNDWKPLKGWKQKSKDLKKKKKEFKKKLIIKGG